MYTRLTKLCIGDKVNRYGNQDFTVLDILGYDYNSEGETLAITVETEHGTARFDRSVFGYVTR